MSCRLLWNSSSHFLYRCNHTIACETIDNNLYICTSLWKQNSEQNQTETKPPVEDTKNNTTSSEEENVSSSTNTAEVISTTRVYQYQTTSLNPSTISNNQTPEFPLQTTTLILKLRTTTNIPAESPVTNPVSYTTKNYNISSKL